MGAYDSASDGAARRIAAAREDDGQSGAAFGPSTRRTVRASLERLRRAERVSDRSRSRLRGCVQHAEDGGRSSTDSAIGCHRAAGSGVATSREAHRARVVRVLNLVRQADLAEQRLAPLDLPGVRDAGPEALALPSSSRLHSRVMAQRREQDLLPEYWDFTS